MKNLYLIGGPMGVGKTTVCNILKEKLPNCVFLDGDWCWNMRPFVINDETKKMVVDNICHMLDNFVHCTTFENIIFCWVMHEQSIIDNIISKIDTASVNIVNISLVATQNELTKRLQKDVENGLRNADVIARSVSRLPLYENLHTIKIDTDNKTAEQVAQKIINLCKLEESAMAIVIVKNKILATKENVFGRIVLSLPKGHVEANETHVDTAIRECWEETGVQLCSKNFLCELASFEVNFVDKQNNYIKKTIYPIVFTPKEFGEPCIKEERILEVAYLDVHEFIEKCSYDNVRNLVKQALICVAKS